MQAEHWDVSCKVVMILNLLGNRLETSIVKKAPVILHPVVQVVVDGSKHKWTSHKVIKVYVHAAK